MWQNTIQPLSQVYRDVHFKYEASYDLWNAENSVKIRQAGNYKVKAEDYKFPEPLPLEIERQMFHSLAKIMTDHKILIVDFDVTRMTSDKATISGKYFDGSELSESKIPQTFFEQIDPFIMNPGICRFQMILSPIDDLTARRDN